MSRKPLPWGVALCVLTCAMSMFVTSYCLGNTPAPNLAAGPTTLPLADGAEGTVLNNTPTTVVVNSSGILVGSLNQVSFLVYYSSGDVNISVTFSNATYNLQNSTPQPMPKQNVLYLKVETNNSAPISGVSVTLKYNASEVLFTERALWVYSYDGQSQWKRIDTTKVDYDAHAVTFPMPSGSSIELCLAGQETRGMEFPIWAWTLILISFGIITFMAVGELVYQGYIPVAMKGTDGRVVVAVKRFFGAWGRKFTQLNDKVGGFIDYYENMSRTVPPIPPEKRPLAVSSLGHINRLGMQEEADQLEEVYRPIITPSPPLIIAKTEDKNPLAKAVFQESHPPAEIKEEPGEKTFTPYIPSAVRAKMGEKPQSKPELKPAKDVRREKPAPVAKPKPPSKEPAIPPDLLQEATAAIYETPKPAKKAAKKKAAKKVSKKAVK